MRRLISPTILAAIISGICGIIGTYMLTRSKSENNINLSEYVRVEKYSQLEKSYATTRSKRDSLSQENRLYRKETTSLRNQNSGLQKHVNDLQSRLNGFRIQREKLNTIGEMQNQKRSFRVRLDIKMEALRFKNSDAGRYLASCDECKRVSKDEQCSICDYAGESKGEAEILKREAEILEAAIAKLDDHIANLSNWSNFVAGKN